MNPKTKNVSVRIDAEIADLIDERAAGKKLERSEFLRQVITDALSEDDGNPHVMLELQQITELLKRTRNDLCRLAVVVLTRHPRKPPMKLEDAKETVHRVFSAE